MAQSTAPFSVSSALASLTVLSTDAKMASTSAPFFAAIVFTAVTISSDKNICLLKCVLRLLTSLYVSIIYTMNAIMPNNTNKIINAATRGQAIHGSSGTIHGSTIVANTT